MSQPSIASWRAHLPVLALVMTGVLALFSTLMLTAFAAPEATYKVQPNDTLGKIAAANDTTIEALMQLNGITDPRKLQVGQTLRIPSRTTSSSASPKTTPSLSPTDKTRAYKVQKGDTLEAIARKNKTLVSLLMQTNHITDPKTLKVGQVLTLPGSIADSIAPTASPKASVTISGKNVQQQMAKTRINTAKWKNIILHHSAANRGSMDGMDGYHRQRGMENGLAYHFVIGNGRGMRDGELGIGNRWVRQLNGGHVKSAAMNSIAIGICLVGDFETSRPTSAQMATLKSLLDYLVKHTRVPTSKIQMHRTVNVTPTKCPGKLFPIKTVQGWW